MTEDFQFGPESAAATNKLPSGEGPVSAKNAQSALIEVANDIERRLKILEDRYNTVRKKTQTTDENLLGLERRFAKDVKVTTADLLELKRTLSVLSEKMAQFSSELDATARRTDLKMLESYVSFIEPLQFVTRQDLKTVITQLKGGAGNQADRI